MKNKLTNSKIKIDERRLKWGIRALFAAIMLLLWQWWGSQPGVIAIASPTKILAELYQVIRNGELFSAARGTFLQLSAGYSLAIVIGVTFGVLIGLSNWAYNTIEPLINILYMAPMIALLPLIGLYFGFDLLARIFVVFLWATFPIIVNTVTGIHNTPIHLLEMAQAFGASRLWCVRTIILPSAVQNIMTGLRIGLGQAIRASITVEFLLSMSNLGKFIFYAQSSFNIARMYAGIVMVTASGILIMRLFEWVEHKVLQHFVVAGG